LVKSSGQICELSQKYHTTVTQISNGLQPTRNLKTKYLLNSRLIKRAVEHHEASLLSVWQFLVKCSYSCAGYERRQRHWALGIEHDHESNDDVLEEDFVEPSTTKCSRSSTQSNEFYGLFNYYSW